MTDNLPKRLKREPLIDATFEVRFDGLGAAASILPGYLFSKLPDEKRIDRLPLEQVPRSMRDSDPNLRFAPLVRLQWGRFILAIGDRVIGVGCAMPYPGWVEFRAAILSVLNELRQVGVVDVVQRCSMKYIDILPYTSIGDQIRAINASVVIGSFPLRAETFSLRMEIPIDNILHVVQLISSAQARLHNGEQREGLIVDVDSIIELGQSKLDSWLEGVSDQLERLHSSNKKMFFDCLTERTLRELEPEYD